MCIWCTIAQQLGGNLCRPCWRKLFVNKKSGETK